MMRKKTAYHYTALFYLFTLGGSLFIFGKCGAFCMLTASAAGFLTLFFVGKIKKEPRFLRFYLTVICMGNGIYTFCKFVLFIKEKQLFYTPVIFIAIIFLAVTLFLFFAKLNTFLKFSLISAAVTAVFFALLFFTTVKNADFSDIKLALDFDLKQTLKVYFALFFPAIIPVVYCKPRLKCSASGSLFAAFTLLVFIILTYCTFGEINTRLNSPILALVDTANVGRVFTRLDAFLLAIIYLSCLIRCAVSFKAAYGFARSLGRKEREIPHIGNF